MRRNYRPAEAVPTSWCLPRPTLNDLPAVIDLRAALVRAVVPRELCDMVERALLAVDAAARKIP